MQNLESVLNHAAAVMSIPPDVVMELFLKSTTELLSALSDLSLHLEFDADKYAIKVYAARQITEDGIGFGEIKYETAKELMGKNPNFIGDKCEIGQFIKQYIRSISLTSDVDLFSRTLINKINASFKGKLLELAKDREFNIFKDKEGELISGTVSRIESGNIIVNVGLGEAFLSKHEIMPGEFFGIGTNIQAYIYEVIRDMSKYQIKLSRTRPEFLGALMYSMIPEIENGLIDIKAIARDPGSRAKVAVYSDQPNIDPVGSCIGRDGIRIKAIRALVSNERMDIVRWDPDIAVFVANALGMDISKDISKFVMHPDNSIEVIFSNENNLFKAKGHQHQQVRLVSRLVKHKIKLISIEEDKERAQREYNLAVEAFGKIGLSDAQIKILFAHDIRSLEDILDADDDILEAAIKDFEGLSIDELRLKTEEIYNQEILREYFELGIDIQLARIPHVAGMHPSFFKKKNLTQKSQLAEMDCDEVEMLFEGYLSEDPESASAEAEDIVRWSRNSEEC